MLRHDFDAERERHRIADFVCACKVEKKNSVVTELTDIRYHGAYQMIVREFAKYACTDEIRYVNREDDAGDEGLRKSKLSWRPCGLLDKFLVHID